MEATGTIQHVHANWNLGRKQGTGLELSSGLDVGSKGIEKNRRTKESRRCLSLDIVVGSLEFILRVKEEEGTPVY